MDMNIIKDKRFIVFSIAVVIFMIFIAIIVGAVSNSEKNVKKRYENTIRELGKNFYENHYYDMLVNSNGINYISAFEDLGFTFDLANLENADTKARDKAKQLYDEKLGKVCNKNTTKVIIHPSDPYGKTDYTLDLELDCGFDK